MSNDFKETLINSPMPCRSFRRLTASKLVNIAPLCLLTSPCQATKSLDRSSGSFNRCFLKIKTSVANRRRLFLNEGIIDLFRFGAQQKRGNARLKETLSDSPAPGPADRRLTVPQPMDNSTAVPFRFSLLNGEITRQAIWLI